MSGALSVPKGAGVIATLVRGEQVVTIHKPGTSTFALLAVARACDRYGWRVRTLSSPPTIYRDLQGPRTYHHGKRPDTYNDHGEIPEGLIPMPEKHMLGLIGRLDLLEERRRR